MMLYNVDTDAANTIEQKDLGGLEAINVGGMSEEGQLLFYGYKGEGKTTRRAWLLYNIHTGVITSEDVPHAERINAQGQMISMGGGDGGEWFFDPASGDFYFESLYPQRRFFTTFLSDSGHVAGISLGQGMDKGFVWHKYEGMTHFPTLGGYMIKVHAVNNKVKVMPSC